MNSHTHNGEVAGCGVRGIRKRFIKLCKENIKLVTYGYMDASFITRSQGHYININSISTVGSSVRYLLHCNAVTKVDS